MMNKYLIPLVVLFGCHQPNIPNLEIVQNFDEIAPLFDQKNDTTYIINFWATTCPPCIKEMPHFESLGQAYKDKKVNIHMISLDSKRRIDPHVRPFLHKLQIKNKIIVLTDQNYTKWTAQVNPKWYGALPYTVIYKGDNKKYFFGAFDDYPSLKNEVAQLLN